MIYTYKLCLKHLCIQLRNTNGMHYTKSIKQNRKSILVLNTNCIYLLTFVKLIKILSYYHH